MPFFLSYSVAVFLKSKVTTGYNPTQVCPNVGEYHMAAWMQFFMNASNHDPPEAPKIASYHWATAHAGHDGKKKNRQS